jgi:hypothetical protein
MYNFSIVSLEHVLTSFNASIDQVPTVAQWLDKHGWRNKRLILRPFDEAQESWGDAALIIKDLETNV